SNVRVLTFSSHWPIVVIRKYNSSPSLQSRCLVWLLHKRSSSSLRCQFICSGSKRENSPEEQIHSNACQFLLSAATPTLCAMKLSTVKSRLKNKKRIRTKTRLK
uniref:Uncharacterized protein n=1 Tax=Neogobius melanostomus TaxID=47308 RepID=A0A8C6SK93_9GOBI